MSYIIMNNFFDSKLYVIKEQTLPQNDERVSLIVFVHGKESEKVRNFIAAILNPLHIGTNEFLVLFRESDFPAFIDLKKAYSANYFLFFDVENADIGLQIATRPYRPFSLLDKGILVVESPEVYFLEKETATTPNAPRPKARMLWESLKLLLKDFK